MPRGPLTHIVKIADIYFPRRDHSDVIVIQVDHLLRHGNHCGSITCNHTFLFADINHDGTTPPSSDHPVRLILGNHRYAKGPFYFRQRGTYGA